MAGIPEGTATLVGKELPEELPGDEDFDPNAEDVGEEEDDEAALAETVPEGIETTPTIEGGAAPKPASGGGAKRRSGGRRRKGEADKELQRIAREDFGKDYSELSSSEMQHCAGRKAQMHIHGTMAGQ